MPNIEIYSKRITDLMGVVDHLLNLAQQESWDDLLLAWPSYESATLNLPKIIWEQLSDDERANLEIQLRSLEANHSRLLELTLDWRAELQEILQSTVQSRRLSDHYR